MSLKFLALSGTTGVTENLYVYEYGNDMIIVDCGIGFPDSGMYGVDLVVPDMDYIVKNKHKLRGAIITHGHEDHIGAIPFLLEKLDTTIYASKLTAGFIKDKLKDYKIRGAKIHVFNPERDTLSIGVFKVTPFRISHSVPDAVALAIDTPEGMMFHVSDYKFDWTPVDGKPFDISKASILASGGVLGLASDSLGATNPGFTVSEKEIEGRVEVIARKSQGQIFFTTMSSNISRVQQAINVAGRLNRKVAFFGRSIDKKSEIARKLGYLHFPKNIVLDRKEILNIKPSQRMCLVSGAYGQPGSALYRMAMGTHDQIKIQKGDTVIFSGDPSPPGSKATVDDLVDKFIEMGVDIHYYDMQEDLHVSGHGSQEDINILFSLVKPKYYIPIGGTIRHNRAYREMAESLGAKSDQVFELSPGDVVEFKNNRARKAKKIPIQEVLVDGLGVGDVGSIVLRDRQILAKEGVAIAVLQFNRAERRLVGRPDIISRGFVFEKQHKDFLVATADKLKEILIKKKLNSDSFIKNETIDFLEKYFNKQTGRRPMIIPVVIEV